MLITVTKLDGRLEPINPDHVTRLIDKTIDKDNPITAIELIHGKKPIRVKGNQEEVKKLLKIQ